MSVRRAYIIIGGILACTATLCFSVPSVAAPIAGSVDEVPLGESLQGDAKAAFNAANLLITNRDFAGASIKLKQAFALSRDARLLFNMAICEKNLHHYAQMQALLQQYKQDAGASLSLPNRERVDGALAAIRDLVGTVKVVGAEAGAAVEIDGALVGTTPLAAAVPLDLGTHTLAVRKDGFEPFQKSIDVAGGSETTVMVTLPASAQAGHLSVVAEASAVVEVDSAPSVLGKFDGPLPSGTHTVHVTAPGKRPYNASLDLHAGETRTVDVTLESARSGSAWPWIAGGAAVIAAGAAVGGYFLLRPTSSGPGAPPPGLAPVGTVNFSALRR